MDSASFSRVTYHPTFEADRYHAFTSHDYNNSYCSQRRFLPPPKETSKEVQLPIAERFAQAAQTIKEILSKLILCRHDMAYINTIFEVTPVEMNRHVIDTPTVNLEPLLKKIKKRVLAILSIHSLEASDLITLYHLSHFNRLHLLDLPPSSVNEKLAQHCDQDLLLKVAIDLPCCCSRRAFNRDVKALIGPEPTTEIDEILEKKRSSLIAHKKLLHEIEARKKTLAHLRAHSSAPPPPYLDELLERGLIHLYDHILEMRQMSDRDERLARVREMSFSDLSHVVLEVRSAILHKVLSVLPKRVDNVVFLFLVGATGSGKSTALRFLMGDQLELKNLCYHSLDQPTVIGHNDAISETLLPNVEMSDNLAIVDFPGFGDTHGPLISLGVELALKALTLEYHPVILILKPILDTGNKGVAANSLGSCLARLLGESSKSRCAIGITKYSQNPHFITVQQIEKKLKKIDNALSKIQDKLDNLTASRSGSNATDKLRRLHKKQQKYQSKSSSLLEQRGEHQKTLLEQEKALCKEVGIHTDRLIRFDDLSDKEHLEWCRNALFRMDRVNAVNPQQKLDSEHKEKIIDHVLNRDLVPRTKDPIRSGLSSINKEGIRKMEQEVLESSLTKVLFSRSHPEIGVFLHLPDMDPTLVHNFDKRVVEDCIIGLLNHIVNESKATSASTLIPKITEQFKNTVPQDVIEELKNEWEKLQKYVVGLGGVAIEHESLEKVEKRWKKLQKSYQSTLDSANEARLQEWELPTWGRIALILPGGIPYGIRYFWQMIDTKLNSNRVAVEEATKLCSDLTKELKDVHKTLVRLKGLEAIIAKREEIDKVCSASKSSFKSATDFKDSLSQKVAAIRNVYRHAQWDLRVNYMAQILTHSKPSLGLSDANSLRFFMLLAIETLGNTALKESLLEVLANEGLKEKATVDSILEPIAPQELTRLFAEGWKEALNLSPLLDNAVHLEYNGKVATHREPVIFSLLLLIAQLKNGGIIGLRGKMLGLRAGAAAALLLGFGIAAAGPVGIALLIGSMIGAKSLSLKAMELAAAEASNAEKLKVAEVIHGVDVSEQVSVSSWAGVLIEAAQVYNQLLADRLDIDLNNPLYRALLQAVLMKNSALFS